MKNPNNEVSKECDYADFLISRERDDRDVETFIERQKEYQEYCRRCAAEETKPMCFEDYLQHHK